MKRALSLAIGVALAGCAGKPPPPFSDTVIDRALAGAPGAAQPSRIVATELAFARAARDEGQWTAFRRFAAPGAIIHGRDGGIAAEAWLAQQSDPDAAVQWAPREVWMSCDATLAISTGRLRNPDGKVGSFVTVWQRQADGEYRWVYDTGAIDDPQPPPRSDDFADGDIVVTALNSVRGHVGDCGAQNAPAPPAGLIQAGATPAGSLARDGSLWWQWVHTADGRRVFESAILQDGTWQPALSRDVPPARAQ